MFYINGLIVWALFLNYSSGIHTHFSNNYLRSFSLLSDTSLCTQIAASFFEDIKEFINFSIVQLPIFSYIIVHVKMFPSKFLFTPNYEIILLW